MEHAHAFDSTLRNHRDGRVLERHAEPYQGRGLHAGATESAMLRLDETVAIMRTMNRVRAQAGSTGIGVNG